MNKSVRSKNLKFIIIVSVLIVIGVIAFTLITSKTNPFQRILGTLVGEEAESAKNDNYNGFYTKKDLLDATYRMFNGCSVYAIDNIIVIQDEDYTLYRSSCMGTYIKDKGKTKDLQIDVENDKYVVTYKDEKYKKDITVNHVVPNNAIASNLLKISLQSFPIIVKETEFKDNYYNIGVEVDGVNTEVHLAYTRNKDDDSFTLSLYKGVSSTVHFYEYKVKDGEELPLLYTIGNQVIVMEDYSNENKYDYKFKSYFGASLSYDLSKFFPIKIDGVELNYGNNSIFIKYNKKDKDFTLLVGNDKKFCLENSNSVKVASYIFKIKYNYNKNTFDSPEYIKSIRGSDGCSEIKGIMGD